MRVIHLKNEKNENVDIALVAMTDGPIRMSISRNGDMTTLDLSPVEVMSIEMMLAESRSEILNHGIREFLKK